MYLPDRSDKKMVSMMDTLQTTVTKGSWSEIKGALRIVIGQWSVNTAVKSDNVDASKWNRHGVGNPSKSDRNCHKILPLACGVFQIITLMKLW
jgi:hypothetical protein